MEGCAMAISLAEQEYINIISFTLKNSGLPLTRCAVFNKDVYDSYLLLLSKEPVKTIKDIKELYAEMNKLRIPDYISYNLIENYSFTNNNIRCLTDIFKGDFLDRFSKNQYHKRFVRISI
jgi:hypothetical protein